MKVYFFCSFFLCFISANIFSQAIKAEIKYVFIDDENAGKYTGGIHIDAGHINVGDKLMPIDENGVQYNFEVISIEDNDLNASVKSLGTGKDGFIVLQTPDKKKLNKNPSGSLTFGTKSTIEKDSKKREVNTICMIDGKEWKGSNYFKSSSYFPNGENLLKTKEPYLIISFRSASTPDDRQLTIQIKGIRPKKGILNKNDYEFVVSGDVNGIPEKACFQSNWKDGKANTAHTDFFLEFTKWDDKGDHIVASAKYSGKLYGLNLFSSLIGKSCSDYMIENGEFQDLHIEVVK